jgi:hypothetical protein
MFQPLQGHQQEIYTGIHVQQICQRCVDEFALLVCLCIFLPDDDLIDVKTCRRNIRDTWLFIIYAIY